MTKVATLLKTVREEKGYELAEISKKIKIPVKYLYAFEEGDTSCYPNEPYCSLSVKDYADFLGLNGQEILRLFRRDYIQKNNDHNAVIASSGITPKTTFGVAMVVLVAFFVIYLFNEYLRFTQPPLLQVDWPRIITGDSVEIDGKTNPDATVRVNQDLVIVNADGTFSKKVSLKDGNKIIVESKSPSGKTTVEEKTLNPTIN
ncbi:helix-turn-helix domain-containing protein [Patescibacteria group bacterium]|nr:helix-turn-helix domain-containing protein [Patescibacteria group bacterium]